MAGFDIKQSLINTESGGNKDAYIKINDGREFFGLGQLGIARLKEVGLDKDFTLQEYKDNDQIQLKALDDDIANTRAYIKKHGLDKQYGTEINGMPFNENAAIAIAHLGGRGGLLKYVNSGGTYNPKDQLGTHLSDYHRKHGVGVGPTIESAEAQARAEGVAPPSRESLKGFQNDMVQGSSATRNWITKSMEDAGLIKPDRERTAQGPLELKHPSVFNAGIIDEEKKPEPEIPLELLAQVQNAVTPNEEEPVTRMTSRNSEGGEPTTPTLMDKIGGFLFPNKDDPAEAFKTMMGGLGVGLGQMSHGRPVDLQPYFTNIATQKQAAADSARKALEHSQDMAIKAMNAETSRMQANTAAQNANLAQQEFGLKMGEFNVANAAPFSEAQMAEYMEDPELAPYVAGLNSPDAKIRQEAFQGMRGVFDKRADELMESEPDLGTLIDAVGRNADPSEIAEIVSKEGLSADDMSKVYTSLGKSPTTLMKNVDAYQKALEENPEAARVMQEYQRNQLGMDETQKERHDREYYELRQEELTNQEVFNDKIDIQLNALEDATIGLLEDGTAGEGPFRGAVELAGSAVRQWFGAEDAAEFETITGFNLNDLYARDRAAATLAMLITKPMIEGQGSVTDNERRELAKMVANPDMSPEARLIAIEQMRVLNNIDSAFARDYESGVSENFSGARSDWHSKRRESGNLGVDMSAKVGNLAILKHASKSELYDKGAQALGDNLKQIFNNIAPTMTQDQFDRYGSAIPALDGNQFWIKRGKDGEEVFMNGRNEVNMSEFRGLLNTYLGGSQ